MQTQLDSSDRTTDPAAGSHGADHPLFQRDERQFILLPMTRNGIRIVWQAYVRESFVTDWFLYNRGSRKALMAEINHRERGEQLPLGEPTWLPHKAFPTETSLEGEVWVLRAQWPNDRELAL